MLAKAPLNISESIKLGSKSPWASPLIHVFSARSPSNRRPRRPFFDCGFSGGGALKCPKNRVLIRAGYSRKPMETPGAYQLIDDETGEKFIVWGGIDDDDAPIPSKEVLSWKPNRMVPRNESSGAGAGAGGGGVGQIGTVFQTDDSTKLHRGTGGSFGRLKAQKVRALSKNASHRKQENAGNDYLHSGTKDASSREWSYLESEHEFVDKKRDMAPFRNKVGISSKAHKSQEFKNAILGTEAMPSLDSTKMNAAPVSEYTSPEPNEHEFEQHKSDVLGPRAAVNASFRGWNGGMSIQNSMPDSNTQFKHHRKITSDSVFFSRKSFRDLGCSEEMIKSLKAQLFVRPSHIQALAFAPVVSGRSCIIADQSGSGKTLAYLAPVIQHLRQEELRGLSKSSSRSPRAVILVPTAELASQVLSNCRSMSKCGVPFRSMVTTGGFRQRTQLEGLQQDLDVLIATPGRFTFLLKEGFLQLTNLKCAVLDEVDILFGDEDFEQVLQGLVNSAPVTTQYLFATATLPVDIYNKLVEIFPDCEVIMGPGMHRTSSGLEEVLIDCSGDDGMEKTPETAFLNKKSALLQLVEERPVSKTIIFCNKIETCRKVENILKRYDRKGIQIQVLPFHSALDQETRLLNMKEFLNYKSKENSQFLICTDRASRGIDFTGVEHVVLFDFPRDPSEYVRRVGRTARGAGGKGKAFVFVVGKQVSLARRIIERNKKGHPIHDVPSAYGLVS